MPSPLWRTLSCSLALSALWVAVVLPARAADALLERGERLFLAHCMACHGPRGEGGKGPTLAVPELPRAGNDDQLIRIIRSGIGGTGMPGFKLEGEELRAIAAWVRDLGQRPQEPLPGDPARGAKTYHERGGCASCHSIRGHGGAVGPDLTDIGLRRSAAHLRTSVTQPEADVPQSFSAYNRYVSLTENYLLVRVTTHDGRAFAGVRVNEDTFSIQLRDLSNRVRSFYKSELKELHHERGKSPMPSYADGLAAGEINDLVAYLVSLRGKS